MDTTTQDDEIGWGPEIEDELLVEIDRCLDDVIGLDSIVRLVGTVTDVDDIGWANQPVIVHADRNAVLGLLEEMDRHRGPYYVRAPRWSLKRVGF